jgi:hypothetical protein
VNFAGAAGPGSGKTRIETAAATGERRRLADYRSDTARRL